jgi:hypothetical protein
MWKIQIYTLSLFDDANGGETLAFVTGELTFVTFYTFDFFLLHKNLCAYMLYMTI